MSESDWQSSKKHIIAMIEEYAAGWVPTGPSKATANAIVSKIRAMPVPGPGGTEGQP